MTTKLLRLAPAVILVSLSLQACKKPAAPPTQPAPTTAASAAPAPVAQAVAAAAPQSEADVIAALEQEAASPTTFDFNAIPEAKTAIPPFPYVAFPPKLGEAFQSSTTLPMDALFVVLGDKLHRLEGRLAVRGFSHSDAQMSELEVRRNYENALKAFGAVKVNAKVPDYPIPFRMHQLRQPNFSMSYDVYLARKGSARHWIVVMTDSDSTRLLSLEELPFAQTIGYEGAASNVPAVTTTGVPPAAPQPFDINAVPVRTAPLPPFPYLAYPAELNKSHYFGEHANFDAVSFIVGKQLHSVEGKVEQRGFYNKDANMSRMAAQRNYEAALTGLGAVKVSTVAATDQALIAANGKEDDMRKKLRIPDQSMSHDTYVLRTPDKNIWVALMFSDERSGFVVVEEKVMQQSVTLVTANTMRTELAAKGHIPLYINFDTDKATIRADGKPAVDEITTLLKNDATLKLSIEGHTDNSGDAKHNLDLSRQRADAVVQQLVASGIDASRLKSAGRGAATPLADNKDDAGRAKNRRVELVKL
jgi:OOP family OmpA-OmpF porin